MVWVVPRGVGSSQREIPELSIDGLLADVEAVVGDFDGGEASLVERGTELRFGVGVERVFPLHSPSVESVTVVRRGRVRRAKLYYLRERTGKAARIREKIQAK